jgi:hypothetical protein
VRLAIEAVDVRDSLDVSVGVMVGIVEATAGLSLQAATKRNIKTTEIRFRPDIISGIGRRRQET